MLDVAARLRRGSVVNRLTCCVIDGPALGGQECVVDVAPFAVAGSGGRRARPFPSPGGCFRRLHVT